MACPALTDIKRSFPMDFPCFFLYVYRAVPVNSADETPWKIIPSPLTYRHGLSETYGNLVPGNFMSHDIFTYLHYIPVLPRCLLVKSPYDHLKPMVLPWFLDDFPIQKHQICCLVPCDFAIVVHLAHQVLQDQPPRRGDQLDAKILGRWGVIWAH